jgi:uncharacterized protein
MNVFCGLGVGQGKPKLIVTALGWALLVTSFAMIFKNVRTHLAQTLRKTAPERFKSVQPILTVVAGVILGILVTLMSVSAGALGTAMLLYLYPFRMRSPDYSLGAFSAAWCRNARFAPLSV